ncbi:MAG: sugar phosphate nucleotidyltransferase [Anaerolineae bacterium]
MGKPIVERVMELLLANGVDDFVLVVSPEDRDITHYFLRETTFPAEVRFVYQTERLGMAKALQCAAPLITGDFVLSACDNLVTAADVGRLMTFWHANLRASAQPKAVLTLMPVTHERISSTGIVAMDGPWITRIVEKPTPEEAPSNISSLPLYVFSPRILAYLPEVAPSPRGEYELQDAIQMLIDAEGHVGGVMIERRLTLTNAADLLALNREYLMHGDGRPQLEPHTVGPDTQLITPLYIEQGTVIGRRCVIGPNVYIERDCRIGDDVTLRDVVVLRDATVADGVKVVNQVVA